MCRTVRYVALIYPVVRDDKLAFLRDTQKKLEERKQSQESRELWLFRLEVKRLEVEWGVSPKRELAEIACGYAKAYGHKMFCFSDLQRWLPYLDDAGTLS